jgi:hypothetical protein
MLLLLLVGMQMTMRSSRRVMQQQGAQRASSRSKQRCVYPASQCVVSRWLGVVLMGCELRSLVQV